MSFTWTCLTICENTDIKPIDCWLSESFTFIKNFFLTWVWTKHIIKVILSVSLPRFNLTSHLIWNFNDVSVTSSIFRIYWSNSSKYSNFTFDILNLIMKFTTFLLLFFILLFTDFHIFYSLCQFLLKLCVFFLRFFCLSSLKFEFFNLVLLSLSFLFKNFNSLFCIV